VHFLAIETETRVPQLHSFSVTGAAPVATGPAPAFSRQGTAAERVE